MDQFEWLDEAVIIAAHAEQLAEHGGGEGIRDRGRLESALARPRNLAAYGEPDPVMLAAAYGFGIVRNHPFVDGNKRTGLIAPELFLELNGMVLTADDEACVLTFLALANGSLSEAELVAWLRANTARQK